MNISLQSITTEKIEKNTKAGQNKTNTSSEINGKNSNELLNLALKYLIFKIAALSETLSRIVP